MPGLFPDTGEDNFAVGAGLEGIAVAIFRAQRLMVVDFAVNGQRVGFLRVVQRLGPGVDVDDRQTLMARMALSLA
jgi:hypothetical protein